MKLLPDRRAHRRRAVVRRGTYQERLGERFIARGRGSLRARRPATATRDPDEPARLTNGAARPFGVGAPCGADRCGVRALVPLWLAARSFRAFRRRTAIRS